MKNQNKNTEKSYARKLISIDSDFTEVENAKYFEIYRKTIFKYKTGKVLDLGCGTGIHSKNLSKNGFEMYASDLSVDVIMKARKKHAGKKIKFLVSDAEKIPFDAGTFDYVFCGAVLHHLPDRNRTIKEIRRVLKTGGKVFSFDPNRRNPYTFLCQNILNKVFDVVGLSKNETSLSPEILMKEFSREGFSKFSFHTTTMFSKRDKGIISKIRPFIVKLQSKTLPQPMADNMIIMDCEKM